MSTSMFVLLVTSFVFCYVKIVSYVKCFNDETFENMPKLILDKLESTKRSSQMIPTHLVNKVIYFSWTATFLYNIAAVIIIALILNVNFLWILSFATAIIITINGISCMKVIFQYIEDTDNFLLPLSFVRMNYIEAMIQFVYYSISLVLVVMTLIA